jgi:uncharacterized protein YkwD
MLGIAAAAAALASPPASASPSSPDDACGVAGAPRSAAAMRCLLNEARRQRGLRPLRHSRALDRAAELRAAAIRRCQDFSHTPCGRSFSSVYNASGYSLSTHSVAENLAWGTGSLGSAAGTVRSWLASPEHRQNMLAGGWKKFGVAVVSARHLDGAQNVTLWVAEFGEP